MKRLGGIFDKIISIDNLYLVEKKSRKNKQECVEYRKELDSNIYNLHLELKSGLFITSEYGHFIIREPKERKVSKLPYKDRIVHHAIINIIGKYLINSFISQTYSCIKSRGILKCLNTLKYYLKDVDNTTYCLKLDIKKFYENVDHNILKELLVSKIKDKRVLELLYNIIDSHKGIPLGNLTSQYFGNFYLNKFDHWIKEPKQVKYYLRYCDDIVILHNDKQYLHNIRKDVQKYLINNLKLELSNYQIFPIKSRGIDFVGYKTYHTHCLLRKSIKQRFINMLNKYPNNKSIASYWGWCKHADCKNLWNEYIKNNKTKNNAKTNN